MLVLDEFIGRKRPCQNKTIWPRKFNDFSNQIHVMFFIEAPMLPFRAYIPVGNVLTFPIPGRNLWIDQGIPQISCVVEMYVS